MKPRHSIFSPMKTVRLLLVLLCLHTTLRAVEITIDSEPFTIPAPRGYSLLTDDMQPWADIAKRYVPSTNKQYALFMPDTDITLVKIGGAPQNNNRRYAVQMLIAGEHDFIGNADFEKIKNGFRNQMNDNANANGAATMKKISDTALNADGGNASTTVNNLTMLPVHDETSRSVSCSMLTKFTVNDNGYDQIMESVATITFVHLKGKVLYLYVYAPKEDLEWSRQASKEWLAEIMAANPVSAAMAQREQAENHSGFNWFSLGKSGFQGAIIGGIVGAIVVLMKRKNKSKSPPPA